MSKELTPEIILERDRRYAREESLRLAVDLFSKGFLIGSDDVILIVAKKFADFINDDNNSVSKV